MFYKLYRYIVERDRIELDPSGHESIFESAVGADERGQYVSYGTQRNSVLMHIRQFDEGFTGLIGKHSIEREITRYEQATDTSGVLTVADDDFPNTKFVCLPELQMIACIDSPQVSAQSAMQRLHRILAHRGRYFFLPRPLRQVDDLRLVMSLFRVVEVDYELLPVNPHTGDLGKQLDENRMLDHIQKLRGKAIGSKDEPLQLNGGHLSAVQELQASGHCRVGFRGFNSDDVEVRLKKPEQARELPEDVDDQTVDAEAPELRIYFEYDVKQYPFTDQHLTSVVDIMKTFHGIEKEKEEELE